MRVTSTASRMRVELEEGRGQGERSGRDFRLSLTNVGSLEFVFVTDTIFSKRRSYSLFVCLIVMKITSVGFGHKQFLICLSN